MSSRKANKESSRSQVVSSNRWFLVNVLILVLVAAFLPESAWSFIVSAPRQRHHHGATFSPLVCLNSLYDSKEEVERELQRARAVLEKSKAKLAAKEEEETPPGESSTAIPFFSATHAMHHIRWPTNLRQ